jgi:hypothetical protein
MVGDEHVQPKESTPCSDVSEIREACAKICDAIEMSYIDAYDPEDDSHPGHSRAMKAAADCAAQCAEAIRAMGKT